MASEPADSLDERAESVTNAVLAALLAEITTLSKDRPPHIAAGRTAPPPTVELIAASKERERTGIGGGLPEAQPSALQNPCSTLPELLADMAECGSRVAASTEQCRASTSAMRAEMASFATAMQISPADTPPRREGSREESPSSSGARIVIRARGHGAIGFVRLPLAADHRPADSTGPTPGERDRRAGPACHDRRAEPAGATFAVVRAAISAQLRLARSYVFLVYADASGEGGVPVAHTQEREPTLTLTPTFNLTLTHTPIFTPSPTQSPTLTHSRTPN